MSNVGKLLRYTQMTGFAIFAMMFGAGNIILPLRLGIEGGASWSWAIFGFCLTGVLVPILGLLGIIAFDGDYEKFFNRLGRIPGSILVFISMIIMGPLVIMPRIVTLSYEMLRPFMPFFSLFTFSLVFLGLAFAATFRKTTLLNLIGRFISPLKVCSLLLIVSLGLWFGMTAMPSMYTPVQLVLKGITFGYGTFDLISALLFGAMIITLLRSYAASQKDEMSQKKLLTIASIGGLGGGALLGLVYVGMCALSAYNGHGLGHLNEGQIFSAISFRALGSWGAALIGGTIFLACFATTISLAAVLGDYTQKVLCRSKISYDWALIIILLLTGIIAQIGLSGIIKFSMPAIEIIYPPFIVLTLCNIAYALWGFKPVKLPVALMAGIMVVVTVAKYLF